MNNNDIMKKLRVALRLRDDDIIKILTLVDFKITESELGAIFRAEDHPKYIVCGDQLLRNFLNGLVIHFRGARDGSTAGEALPKRPQTRQERRPGNPDSPRREPRSDAPKKEFKGERSDSARRDSRNERPGAPKRDYKSDKPSAPRRDGKNGGASAPRRDSKFGAERSTERPPMRDGDKPRPPRTFDPDAPRGPWRDFTGKTKTGKKKFKIDDREEHRKAKEAILAAEPSQEFLDSLDF